MSNPVDLSSLPEEERQQLQKLQERFEEHQQLQKQQQEQVPNHPSQSYGPSQVQSHPPYDQPYQPYYGYYPPYPTPVPSSLLHPPFPPDQQQLQQQQQQQHYYQDHQLQHQHQHYYHTEHINAYEENHLQPPNSHPQQLPTQIVPIPHPSAHLINLHPQPPQPQSQHLPPPTGQVQVHHQQNVYYPQIGRGDGDKRQSGPLNPLNPAAAAAVAALSQLVQFAGTMGDAERALAMIGLQASGVAGYGPPMGPSVGPQLPQDPVSFMPLAGQSMYMGGGDTRGGGSSFPNKPQGKNRQRNGKGKIGPKLPFQPSSMPEPTGTAANKPQTPAAWCELCSVECTSQEILKQHMIGKRHMKNLEKNATSSAVVQNNIQNSNTTTADATALNTTSTTDSETANAQPQPQPQANEEENINNKPAGTTNSLARQKREPNHKTKGGKRAKLSDMQKRTFENSKPKVVVPLSCGLCNIKCDTQEVLNKHLSGKKHISKLRRYESHPQAVYDQNRIIQPLYHTNAPIGPPPLHFPQAHLHHQQSYYPAPAVPAPAAPASILSFVEVNQNQQLG